MTEQRAARPTYAEATRGLLRDTVLDATDDLVRGSAWGSVTMAGVAAAAGVSRQTVYNEFGSRQALAQAYVLREVGRFLDAVRDAVLANADNPHSAITAAYGVFLGLAADHPLVKTISTSDGRAGNAELLALITTGGQPVLVLATEYLSELILLTWPHVDPAAVRLLAESVTRLAITHAILPGGAAERTARSVGDLLAPFITAETGIAPSQPDNDSPAGR